MRVIQHGILCCEGALRKGFALQLGPPLSHFRGVLLELGDFSGRKSRRTGVPGFFFPISAPRLGEPPGTFVSMLFRRLLWAP